MMRPFVVCLLLSACHPTAQQAIDAAPTADLHDDDMRHRLLTIGDAATLYVIATSVSPKVKGAEVTGDDPAHPTRVVFRDYGSFEDVEECPGKRTGSVMRGDTHVSKRDASTYDFDTALVYETTRYELCLERKTTWAVIYRGTLRETPEGRSFDGKGEVAVDARGTISTEGQLIASTGCVSEPSAGSTTVSSGADSATLTYDGATACDTGKPLAKLTLNGEDLGFSGVTLCSASQPELFLWLIAAFVLRKRRVFA